MTEVLLYRNLYLYPEFDGAVPAEKYCKQLLDCVALLSVASRSILFRLKDGAVISTFSHVYIHSRLFPRACLHALQDKVVFYF